MTHVRRLDLADGAAVVALLRVQRAAYAIEAELIGSDAIPGLHEDAAALQASGETLLAASVDALPGGAATPGPEGVLAGALGYVRTGDVLAIHRLVVDPAAFRRGIATALLRALADAEPGVSRTVVATGTANAPALALYRRHGFEPVGERVVGPGIAITDLARSG